MRAVVWLFVLFAFATGLAVLAGSNGAVVTLYISEQRAIDISMNLAILTVLVTFFLGYAALLMLGALPRYTQQWREQRASQREQTAYGKLLEGYAQHQTGQHEAARVSALNALRSAQNLDANSSTVQQLLVHAHALVARTSLLLQDHAAHQQHVEQAQALLHKLPMQQTEVLRAVLQSA